MEIINKLKLIDFFSLILCLRIIYSAVFKGIVKESFKFIAIITAALFAFHFYAFMAEAISSKVKFLNASSLYYISFLMILFLIWLVLVLLMKIFSTLFSHDEISGKEKVASLIVGLGRFVFTVSVVIFLLYLTPLKSPSYMKSMTSKVFGKIAPKAYLIAATIVHNSNASIQANEAVKDYEANFGEMADDKDDTYSRYRSKDKSKDKD